MKFTPELEILVESIKVGLLEKPSERLFKLLSNDKIDWKRLEKMAAYHAVRPVVYEAFTKVQFQNEFTEKLQRFCMEQAVMNLTTAHELTHVLELLRRKGISVSPYKGIFFLENLYDGKQLREIGDLDILVHPSDAKNALKLLSEDGYFWADGVRLSDFSDEGIDFLLQFPPKEVGLDKGLIHIDFQWGIAEQYIDLPYDFTQLLENNSVSAEKILFMILIHHGKRDCWLRLKYIVDFYMFLSKYQMQIDWRQINKHLKQYKLQKSTEIGFSLVDLLFEGKGVRNEKAEQLIINYWEKAEIWKSLRNKIRYNQIFFSMQDASFSKFQYIKRYFKANSYPNPVENKRIITFPHNYPFLNLSSKILSMLIRNLFGR